MNKKAGSVEEQAWTPTQDPSVTGFYFGKMSFFSLMIFSST
jgi:hypothetical protein